MVQEFGALRQTTWIRPGKIFKYVLQLPQISRSARPGQFLHLLVPHTPGVLLRRPFSIARTEGDSLELIIRIVGTGTEALSCFGNGTIFDVLGPQGQGYNWSEVKSAYLVGGGIGVAPLLMLQDELKKRGITVNFWCGAKTHDEFPLSDSEVKERSIVATTDDGSFGERGVVSQVLAAWLAQNQLDGAKVFSCGPTAMMKAVAKICYRYRLPHQVSLENRMACGIGVCQGCAIRTNVQDECGGFRLVCKEGPVFPAEMIDWSLLP